MLTKPVTEIFGVRASDALKNNLDQIIEVEVLPDRTDGTEKFLVEEDAGYVFNMNTALTLVEALDARAKEPVLIHGLHGSGKSTLAEQVSRKLNRPSMRVQHSSATEPSDIVGGWVLEGNKTVFHYGPLARAMIAGLVYIGDEYDFALPNVLAVYQAVLEGGNLFIKEAPESMALVKPHPDFRFIATGNTNGSGDETGLYQGTQIQNAANYSRFGTTIKVDYQTPEVEAKIVKNKVGELPELDIDQLMEFVSKVRTAYSQRTITNTVSTREIISIANKAVLRGRDRPDWKHGISVGFTNRMSSSDAGAIQQIVDRIFG